MASNKNRATKINRKLRTRELQEVERDFTHDIVDPGRNSGTMVTVARTDFSPAVNKILRPFNTWGGETVRVRATYYLGNLNQAVLTNARSAVAFVLSDWPGNSEMLTCFDQYRIRGASVKFTPSIPSSNFTGTNINSSMYTCLDYDDIATPASVAAIQAYGSALATPPGLGIVRTLAPRIATAAYSGAFTSFANSKAQWIDSSSPNVQHYGVKVALAAGNTGQTVLQSYTTEVTLFLEFKMAR